ncbi:MAG: FkbM family methyltransferase [Anaerolineales bacterium]
MELWSLKETYLDRFYERCGFPLQEDWVVIDIGAGLGEFTLDAARHPNNRVYAYEPFGPSFELLKANLNLNRVANVEAFQEAVAEEGGVVRLDISEPEPIKMHTVGHNENGLEVLAITLPQIFKRHAIQLCHLLKMDCEGAEYEILFSTPPEVLARIYRIVMEYHEGAANRNHKELSNYLKNYGFEVETFANYVHKDLGYLRAWRNEPLS